MSKVSIQTDEELLDLERYAEQNFVLPGLSSLLGKLESVASFESDSSSDPLKLLETFNGASACFQVGIPWSEPDPQQQQQQQQARAALRQWHAVPVGDRVTLFYDSDLDKFPDAAVAIAGGFGLLNAIPPLGNVLITGGATLSLWQDLDALSKSRNYMEMGKYSLGALADTAIISGALSGFSRTVPYELKIGLVTAGFVGRMLVELIPNLVKTE